MISPFGVSSNAGGKTAFVALGRADRVALVDLEALKVRKDLLVYDRVWRLVLSLDGQTLYAANDVCIIDVASLGVSRSVPAGRPPWSLAIVP